MPDNWEMDATKPNDYFFVEAKRGREFIMRLTSGADEVELAGGETEHLGRLRLVVAAEPDERVEHLLVAHPQHRLTLHVARGDERVDAPGARPPMNPPPGSPSW